jgi:hypothetical protein
MQYSIYNADDDQGRNGDQIPISAKTDTGARRQAKKEAAAQGWINYGIRFFRASDGCHGSIEV